MLSRKEYITSRALRNFLAASIMTSLAGQLAVTTDAVIVSHMIGPDAVSAINMVMPLTMLFSCASILLGLGGSVLAAKAMGEHNGALVNRIFTVALMLLAVSGAALSLFTHAASEDIVAGICDEARIAPMALEYTDIITAGAFFLVMSNGMNYFVSTDGRPGLVTRGVVAGAISNIVLDIVLVAYIGIEGSAIATVVSYIVTLAVVSTHFFGKRSSYRLVNPMKGFGGYVGRNIYEGLPLMLGNLFLGGAVFAINSMILSAAGADGIYIWTVCMQILMMTFVVLNGVGNAMLSIGSVLVGEKDYRGVHMLTMLSLRLVCGSLAALVVLLLLFPQAISFIFGATGSGIEIENPLRIFSLLLIPFAVTLVMRFLFQILEYRMLSLLLSVGQLVGIVLCLWLFTTYAPETLWWSFPASALVLVTLQLAATTLMCIGKKGVSAITLIPDADIDSSSLDMSVDYDAESMSGALVRIEKFLAGKKIAMFKEHCREIMQALASDAAGKCRCFDIHVRILEDEVHMVLRDVGKRLEPQRLLAKIDGVECKYMYGQNVVFLRRTIVRL